MMNPTYHMEGIIKDKDDMQDFEGPLTLPLQLLSKNKIEIEDVKISQILQQYMEYLEEMKSMDLEVASEFIQMASHLIYIKTKTLLTGDEEIPEMELLISSMEELKRREAYTQIKSVTGVLLDMSRMGQGLTVKPPEYIAPDKEYRYSHDVSELLEAFLGIFDRETDIPEHEGREFTMPSRIVYSVTDKAEEIIAKLGKASGVGISALFQESRSRSEVVATFIAILELCKTGYICFGPDGDDLLLNSTGG